MQGLADSVHGILVFTFTKSLSQHTYPKKTPYPLFSRSAYNHDANAIIRSLTPAFILLHKEGCFLIPILYFSIIDPANYFWIICIIATIVTTIIEKIIVFRFLKSMIAHEIPIQITMCASNSPSLLG